MYAIAQREGLGMDKAVEICKDRMSRCARQLEAPKSTPLQSNSIPSTPLLSHTCILFLCVYSYGVTPNVSLNSYQHRIGYLVPNISKTHTLCHSLARRSWSCLRR